MIILSCSLFASRHFDRFFVLQRFVSLAPVTIDDKITFNFQVLVKMPRDQPSRKYSKDAMSGFHNWCCVGPAGVERMTVRIAARSTQPLVLS